MSPSDARREAARKNKTAVKASQVSRAKQIRPVKRRIIGIDPGLASTGWGVLDCEGGKIRYVNHGHIETRADIPRAQRLFFIQQSIRSILKEYKPGEAAIETLYFGKNISSAIPVAEARGVISAALAEKELIVLELTPNSIKKGVAGLAKADKKQIQEMVKIILGLTEIPKPDHAADALGAAICAAMTPVGTFAVGCQAADSGKKGATV